MPDPYEGKSRVHRLVSFNPRDRTQRMLLEYIDRRDVNFSGLVKHLLFAHLTSGGSPGGALAQSVFSTPTAGRGERQRGMEAEHMPTSTSPSSPVLSTSNKPPFGGMPVDF
ncbi:hypothetical protein GCM10007416_19160 [Kroppenstedtia guangzhouensis]|jgi:hypothetical protein|uniref:Uncharacterized protein n=1 Tax=Kroppenstedtia guangzhouensis TaxID=1274356 RepID=A0ABQ1GM76_9BACL|nr:hypothetical protein [Kroppenstedtia guangzhouensis]GGA46160.1 hypothetical protein GCM10007416_19160 [Kroppenstedtia guangzhouensis]